MLQFIGQNRGRRCRDRIVVGYPTTRAVSAYHHCSFEFEPSPWRGVLDAILFDKISQSLGTCRLFFLGSSVFFSNKLTTTIDLKHHQQSEPLI